jgi:hypothetical protein
MKDDPTDGTASSALYKVALVAGASKAKTPSNGASEKSRTVSTTRNVGVLTVRVTTRPSLPTNERTDE